MKKISNKGFTLIELLATILIIGLVLGITTYGIIISVNKAKEKNTILSLTSVKEAARTYSGELGEDSWKNISDYEDTYFCVTIEELINKGLLNKNANSVENGVEIDNYVVVVKNKTTKVIEKEEILTGSNSDTVAYKICTGNIKNENITNGTKITNSDSSTDEAYINFTDAYSESEDIVIIKKYCNYSDSSTKLDSGAKEGTITDNKCTLEGLTQGIKYWVRVCEETKRGSESCDTGSVTTKNIVAPTIAVDTNKNNSVKITYDNSNIIGDAFYYFKSTIDGTSSINVSTCSLNNDKYTCYNDSVNNITKDTWYKVSNKEISITYSTPGNITVTAETRDKSNNSTPITKEFSLYKTTFNKGNADTIGGQTNNIELMCLANRGGTCSITSPSIEKSGYQVIGWNTNGSATTSSWNAEETKSINTTETYYPLTKSNTYTITYYNGSTRLGTSSHNYNKTRALTTWKALGGSVTNSSYGWTFAGWSTKKASTTITYKDGQSVSNLTSTNRGNVNLYVVYERTITFKHGINSVTTSTTTQYWNPYGTTNGAHVGGVTSPSLTAIINWTSKGFRNDTTASSSEYSAETTIYPAVAESPTLYGVYSRSYTANFYSGVNRATTTSVTSSTAYYNSNASAPPTTVSIKTDTATNSTNISNWTELGWRDDTTAGAKEYSYGTAITVAWGTNFYGVYSRDLTISYNGNNSTSGSTSSTKKTVYLNANSTTTSSQSVTLASNGFARKNYTFSKWAAGSTSGTQYAAGDKYNANIAYNASTFGKTMYAIWQANSTTSTINANRYICSSYNGSYRLSIFYITTKTIVNNNQSCAYTKLNGLGSASDFSNNLYSTNPSWSIDCKTLDGVLSSNCKAPTYYITANSGLQCRSGASLDDSYYGDRTFSKCTELDSIYLTTSKMNNDGTKNWYYDSNTGCYLRGDYLSSSNPCSSSGDGGGSESNEYCHCTVPEDCDMMPGFTSKDCIGGSCYYSKEGYNFKPGCF